MTLTDGTTVSVFGYGYWVELISGSIHIVSKSRKCNCVDGATCLSVKKVEEYLREGGGRAPEYPPDFFLSVPRSCPVCSAECIEYAELDFTEHGVGWKCLAGGTLHYWYARAMSMQTELRSRSPHWVIRPVISEDGKVLYAGVATAEFLKVREEARTWYYGKE